MNRYYIDVKAEMQMSVATELQANEQTQGPVYLSAEQRRMASAAVPVRASGKDNVEAVRDFGRDLGWDAGRDSGRDSGREATRDPTRSSFPSAPAIPSREPEQPCLTRSR